MTSLQTAPETRYVRMPRPSGVRWLATGVGIVRELGAVCMDLRERAGLDIRRDMEFFVRRDYRTLQKFEAGDAVDEPDAIVQGYANALEMPVSELVGLALDRLKKAEGNPAAAVEQALDDAARAVRSKNASNGRTRSAKRSRREVS